MTPITLNLPAGSRVSNFLYPSPEANDLTQDLLLVTLPNGVSIDVGWYPEHDPKGRYVIRVFQDCWDKQLMDPVETRNVDEIAGQVERLATEWALRGTARSLQ